MKGIFLLGALLAVLLVAYLMMSRLQVPAPAAVESTLGATTLPDAPAKAKSLVEESMAKEAERIKAMEDESGMTEPK